MANQNHLGDQLQINNRIQRTSLLLGASNYKPGQNGRFSGLPLAILDDTRVLLNAKEFLAVIPLVFLPTCRESNTEYVF